ncbi:caspase-3-like [Dendronephthya gigantea]|uniref:caspase-3-like n=1 Tax=Dendronephthya gigantea TaxID=151771 RepID=UPI00106CE0C1|nr:caspase-3-like [Dendronephthya gigantea]
MEFNAEQIKSEALQINKGFALMVINKKFKQFAFRYCADADRKNIKTFCENAGLTINDTKGLKTDDLTADEIEDLFKTISKTDFSSYDAFVCFISSHGDPGEILGVDGGSITVKEIIRPINRCSSLEGKPKLFFIQSGRGYKKHTDISQAKRRVVADSLGFPSITISIPIEADILVAYSSLNGYELYRKASEGSWFITALTQVLSNHARDMNLTDMLAIVLKMVSGTQHCGRKQTPLFMSTLRKTVWFKVLDCIESG